MSSTCKIVNEQHRAAAKVLGKNYSGEYVASVEGKLESLMTDEGLGGEVLKGNGYTVKDVVEVGEIMKKIEAGEAVVGDYVRMVEKDRAAEWRKEVDYRENNDAKAIEAMREKIYGTELSRMTRSIGMRFVETMDRVSADNPGVSRLSLLERRRGGVKKVLDMMFEEYRSDLERTRRAKGLYSGWLEAKKSGEGEKAEAMRREIGNMLDVDSGDRLLHIGTLEVAGGVMEIGAQYNLTEDDIARKIEALEGAVATYEDLLGSWSIMCKLAGGDIAMYEGVRFDGSLNVRADVDNVMEYSPDERTEDEGETTGDIFRTDSEFRAVWKSVPNEVRSLLGKIPYVDADSGLPKWNAVGEPVYVNVMTAFQDMLYLLRTSGDSAEMMDTLFEWCKFNKEYQGFYDTLVADPRLRTDVWTALKRGQQLYEQFFENEIDGVVNVSSHILNGRLNRARRSLLNIKNGRKITYIGRLMGDFGDNVLMADGSQAFLWEGEMVYGRDGLPNSAGGKRVEKERDELVHGKNSLERGFKELRKEKYFELEFGQGTHSVAERLDAIVRKWYVPVQNKAKDGQRIVGRSGQCLLELTATDAVKRGEITRDQMNAWDFWRYNVLIESACAVGIDMHPKAALKLMANSEELRRFVRSYRVLMFEHVQSQQMGGGLTAVDASQVEFMGALDKWDVSILNNYAGSHTKKDTFYHRLTAASSTNARDNKVTTEREFRRIDGILARVGEQGDYSNRATARWRGEGNKTYESAIEPSFLTEFIDSVHGKEGDKLEKYLEDRWLKDEKYRFGGFIFNPILRALHYDSKYRENGKEAVDGSVPLSKGIAFTCDLGRSDKASEDMSDKEKCNQEIHKFFEDEETFFGDSNLNKVVYMTAEDFVEAFNNGTLGNIMAEGGKIIESKAGDSCRVVVSGYYKEVTDEETGEKRLVVEREPAGEGEPGYLPQNVFSFYRGQDKWYPGINTRDVPMGKYQIFVQGDSNKSRYIKLPRYAVGDVLDEWLNIFMSETFRMRQVQELQRDGKNVLNYCVDKKGNNVNGDRFTMMTFMNPIIDDLWEKVQNGETVAWEGGPIVTGEPRSKYEMIQMLDFGFVRQMIANEMERGFADYLAYLNEIGLLETTKLGDTKVFKYLNDIGGQTGNYTAYPYTYIVERLKDYYYNNRLMQVSMCQLFGGDASMFANTEDHQKRWKQIVANGYMLDKAAEYVLGNGETDNTAAMTDPYERSLYVTDIKTNCEDDQPEFMAGIVVARSGGAVTAEEALELVKAKDHEKIKSLIGSFNYRWRYEPYTKNTLTDGQAWRCLTSYRAIMIKRGGKMWTGREEEAYREIQKLRAKIKEENREATVDEIQQIENYAAVFQPLKPFSYGFEEVKYVAKDANGNPVLDNNGNPVTKTALIGCQHKCSDAVIIPELLEKGSKLRAMADMMEESQERANADPTGETMKIDCIYSTESVKVGIYQPLSLNGTAEEMKEVMEEAVRTGYGVHSLNWDYYRIQQNVPQHVNEERRFGTQLMKVGMSDLDFSQKADYSRYFQNDGAAGMTKSEPDKGICIGRNMDGTPLYASEKMSAMELNQLYQSQFLCNMMECIAEFSRKLKDKKTISDEVIATLQQNLRANIDNIYGYMMEEGTDEFIMPLFESAVEKETAGALLSMFRNIVNKQMAHGGSAVQMSSFGLRKEDDYGGLRCSFDKQNNVIDVECELSWAEEYTDSRGRTVKLRFEDYNERTADGSWELKKDADGVPLIEKEFPGILNILAYRIPTERCYSILNLRVVRFTPMTAGGVIKVPHQFTTVAGFDFDIDKLYMVRKSFVESKEYKTEREKLSKEDWKRVLRAVKAEHPSYVKEVPSVTEESFSQSDLYDIFGYIYNEHEDIKWALENERKEGDKTPLNQFWEKSEHIKYKAQQLGYDDVMEYKAFLVREAAEELGLTPTESTVVKDSYLTYDREAIAKDGKTLGKVINDTAKSLGIEVEKIPDVPRWQEYDLSKPPMEQSSSGVRSNMILYILQQRLKDPETFLSRMTPGGFDKEKTVSKMMKFLTTLAPEETREEEAYEKAVSFMNDEENDAVMPLDFSEPQTLLHFNRLNQIAAKLIGMFANHSTNNIFSQLLSVFELADGHEIKIFESGKRGIGKKLVYREEPEIKHLIDESMAEMLASSVDAPKNPVLDYLGINEKTANVAALMFRTGFEVEDVALFLKQPVIEELCNLMQRDNLGIDRAITVLQKSLLRGKDVKAPEIDSLITKKNCAKTILQYSRAKRKDRQAFVDDYLASGTPHIDDRDTDRDEKKYGNEVTKLFGENSFLNSQLAVLGMFKDMAESAKQLSGWIMTTKYTAAGTIGTTPGAIYSTLYKTEQQNTPENFVIRYETPYGKSDESGRTIRYDDETVDGETLDELITTEGKDEEKKMSDWSKFVTWCLHSPFGIEQGMYNLLKYSMKKVIGKVMPYETERYKKLVAMTTEVSDGQLASADMLNSEFAEFQLFFMATRKGGLLDFNKLVDDPNSETKSAEEITDRRVQVYAFQNNLSEEEARKILESTGDKKQIKYSDYLQKYFPKIYLDFIGKYSEEIKDYDLFNLAIDVNTDENMYEESPQRLSMSSIANNPTYRDQLQGEIMDTMHHYEREDGGDKQAFYDEAMNILVDLYAYGVLQRGFDYTNMNFNQLMPDSFKRQLAMASPTLDNPQRYVDVLRGMMGDDGLSSEDMDAAVRVFIIGYTLRHLWDTRTLMKFINQNPDKRELEILGGNRHDIIISGDEDLSKIAKSKTKEGVYTFPPVIVSGRRHNPKYSKNGDDSRDALVYMLADDNLEGFSGKVMSVTYKYVGKWYELASNSLITYDSDNIVSKTQKAETGKVETVVSTVGSEDISSSEYYLVPDETEVPSDSDTKQDGDARVAVADAIDNLQGEEDVSEMQKPSKQPTEDGKLSELAESAAESEVVDANGEPAC